MITPVPQRRTRSGLALLWLIVICYLIVATLYAVKTPMWQMPDEPAHYNYIRYLAEHRSFPILNAGDYPHEYLEEIKSRRFPPEMSIDPIRYESHQPPLYYVIAAGLYSLVSGAALSVQVVALRLLSVALGAGLLVVAYHIVTTIFPGRPGLALGATAFVAFVPMHVAFTAAISNDTLAELMLALILLALVRYLAWRAASQQPTPIGRLLALGLLLGLALITKSNVYIAFPLVLAALAWGELRHAGPDRPLARFTRAGALVLLPALLIAMPWWVRNVHIYGGLDILGLRQHDAIVVGQPRTSEWIANIGIVLFLERFARTTFQSFWGQFGWMGVPLDSRIYALLLLFSALIAFGVLTATWRIQRRRPRLERWQWAALGLLGLSALLTLGGYIWYNLQFVQHQGRYLFPALIPLGLLAAIGLRELFTRQGSLGAAAALIIGILALIAFGLLRNRLPLASLAVLALLAAGFGMLGLMLRPSEGTRLMAVSYVGMLALDLISLFWFVIPGT